jgi:hypothetical protein
MPSLPMPAAHTRGDRATAVCGISSSRNNARIATLLGANRTRIPLAVHKCGFIQEREVSQVRKLIASVTSLVALAACGGGGDSPPLAKYSQTDIKNVAALGVLTTAITGDKVGFDLGFFAGFLQGLSTDTGGSRTVTNASCVINGSGGGTLTTTITKSAVHTGLIAGDQVTLTAVNCTVGGTSQTINGTAALTAQSTVVSTVSGTFKLSYQADLSNFSVKTSASTTNAIGVINAVYELTGNNSVAQSFTVPAGHAFAASVATGSNLFVMSYDAATTFASTDVISPNSASRKLDGTLTAGTTAATVPLVVATPTALSGTTTSGLFVATSGAINTKSNDLPTSITFSGNTATVSGDTDGNGSLDLTFLSSWAALTQ